MAILRANSTAKSTLLHLITSTLQPCEGTISKHPADQMPYERNPIECTVLPKPVFAEISEEYHGEGGY